MEKDSFKKILKDIRPMTKEERQRAKEREAYNTVGFNLCVSCVVLHLIRGVSFV